MMEDKTEKITPEDIAEYKHGRNVGLVGAALSLVFFAATLKPATKIIDQVKYRPHHTMTFKEDTVEFSNSMLGALTGAFTMFGIVGQIGFLQRKALFKKQSSLAP